MRILFVNDYFCQHGGVETAMLNSAQILQQKGHEVIFFSIDRPNNYKTEYSKYFVSYRHSFKGLSIMGKIFLVINTIYSLESRRKIKKIIIEQKPDIVHIHSIQPGISLSIIDEIKGHNIPIVMTLHSYKTVCALNSLFINSKICEACSNKKFYFGFLKKCIYESFTKSFVMMCEMYLHHIFLKTYEKIDLCISPSFFLKNQVKKMGFRKDIIIVPNAIDINSYSPSFGFEEQSIVYFGRLAKEKGIEILLDAIKKIDIKLKIIGDGPERNRLEEKVRKENIKNVDFLGIRDKEQLIREISKSKFSILPSVCFETFSYTILESFALGKSAIGSNLGAIPELIKDSENGFLFKPGDSEDLRHKILRLLNDQQLMIKMGQNARRWIEDNFNHKRTYQRLINEYAVILRK